MLKNILICMIKTKYNLKNQKVGEGEIYNDKKHIRNPFTCKKFRKGDRFLSK